MDIEAMARAAGSDAWDIWRDGRGELCVSLDGISLTEELVKFAELVAAAEREACAKVCESMSGNEPSGNSGRFGALDCAEAIRMRSNVEGEPGRTND